MSSIIRRTINGRIYLYESTSYRDEQGRPRNKKKYIGKIDAITGEAVCKSNLTSSQNTEQKPVENKMTEKSYTLKDVQKSDVKEFGAYYFYNPSFEQIIVKR